MKAEFNTKRAAKPQIDPDTLQDLKTDPMGLITEAMGKDEGEAPKKQAPFKPEKHTVEPELEGSAYHMVGAGVPKYWRVYCHFKGGRDYFPYVKADTRTAAIEIAQQESLNTPREDGKPYLKYTAVREERHPIGCDCQECEETRGSKVGHKDRYCDACDRPENQCVCDPCYCDLTKKRGAEDTRLPGDSPEVDYQELKGAWKDADCTVVKVPGGVSKELGCCNKWERANEGVQEFKCGTCEYLFERKGGMRLGNTVTIVGAKKAEGNMEKSSRETLREKIGAIAEQRKAAEYGTLREVAAKQPHKVGEALGELAKSAGILANSFASLQDNLDLAEVPRIAGLTVRVAARRKYANEFRRIADKNPEMLSDAVIELYRSLDEVVAGVENLASNMGIDLPDDFEEVPGEELETPQEQALEDEQGIEGTQADKAQDEALEEKEAGGGSSGFVTDRGNSTGPKDPRKVKNRTATGGAGFVTNRDKDAEPKPTEKAEIPRSQGEAAIKA